MKKVTRKTRLLYLITAIMVLCLAIIFLGTNFFKSHSKEIVSEKDGDKKVYSTGISMMLETSAGSGEYQETTDTTWAQAIEKGYLFNETMSKCENGSTLTWNETNKTVEFTGNISDRCYVYFDIKRPTAAEIITNLYTSDGEGGLYKHDGVGTYGAYEAGDNSIRYAGANPNNYVCFGSSAATCPTDNLYRIIGIFDGQMKLIKYDYATTTQMGNNGAYSNTYAGTGWSTSYYKGKNSTSDIGVYSWNNSTNNTWSQSNLYSINLNTNFKSYLQTAGGKDWTQYVDTKTWKVGGNTATKIYSETNAKTNYQNELVNPATADTVIAMFGLMYVSEYRYAADPTKSNAWSALTGWDFDANKDFRAVKSYNWMYMGLYERTISRRSDTSNQTFHVYEYGNVATNSVSDYFGVRPCFYLKSTVELSSGTGTQSDPYILK